MEENTDSATLLSLDDIISGLRELLSLLAGSATLARDEEVKEEIHRLCRLANGKLDEIPDAIKYEVKKIVASMSLSETLGEEGEDFYVENPD